MIANERIHQLMKPTAKLSPSEEIIRKLSRLASAQDVHEDVLIEASLMQRLAWTRTFGKDR